MTKMTPITTRRHVRSRLLGESRVRRIHGPRRQPGQRNLLQSRDYRDRFAPAHGPEGSVRGCFRRPTWLLKGPTIATLTPQKRQGRTAGMRFRQRGGLRVGRRHTARGLAARRGRDLPGGGRRAGALAGKRRKQHGRSGTTDATLGSFLRVRHGRAIRRQGGLFGMTAPQKFATGTGFRTSSSG